MKIEVCESLVSSWFKHIKKCSIVQINWTVSPYWGIDYTRFGKVCNAVDQTFSEKYDIIKWTTGIDQFIKQGEADVVGIKIKNNETTVFAADTAFHENGLGYGDTKENVSRVLKKFFRTALTINAVYGNVSGEIAFISPKIRDKTLEHLIPAIKDLQNILNNYGFDFKLKLYANDDFISKVLTPVLEITKMVSDDNELFLRSIQLGSIAKNFKPEKNKKSVIHNVSEVIVSPASNPSVSEPLALGMFKSYLKKQGVTDDVIESYCCLIERNVLKVEHENWNSLTNHIDKIVPIYDVNGKHQNFGKACHGTVTLIDALKRFREFVHDHNLPKHRYSYASNF